MRVLLLVLSWYTIVLTSIYIVLAPIVLDDSLTPSKVIVVSILALPVLIYAVLVLVHLRRPAANVSEVSDAE